MLSLSLERCTCDDVIDATVQPSMMDEIDALSAIESDESLESFVIGLRRSFHEIPELLYNEVKTSAKIKEVLTSLGVRHEGGYGVNTRGPRAGGPGGTGVVATIGTGNPPCVLLRTDMDGLPIVERKSDDHYMKDHVSVTGNMHACGHDGHIR